MKFEKEDIFKAMVESEGMAHSLLDEIPRKEGAREGEASFSQTRIWINQLLDPNSSVYNVLLSVRIEGDLYLSAFEFALQSIVDRHESLRTLFKIKGGTPYQHVVEKVPAAIEYIDFRDVAEKDTHIDKWLASEHSRIFDLSNGPLFRFSLCKLATDHHILAISLHHIIFDYVSSNILLNDFSEFYLKYSATDTPLVEASGIQYIDFSNWQRERFQKGDLGQSLEYWKSYLGTGNDISAIEIHGDLADTDSFVSASERFDIPSELHASVIDASRALATTNFCVFVTVYQILLSKYSGSKDVVISVPTSERNHPDLDDVIGFFVNLIILKLRVEGWKSFRELVKETHDAYLCATDHGAYPFEKLVEALSPNRVQGYARMAQIGFGYQKAKSSNWEIGNLKVSLVGGGVPIAKSDFSISIFEAENRCAGIVEYNAESFSQGMVGRIAGDYGLMLKDLIDNCDRPIDEVLRTVDIQEKRSLSDSSSQPDGHGEFSTLHGGFECQCEINGDCIALAMDGVSISYRELNRRSNRLARELMKSGVGLGSVVALLVNRNVDTYTLVLAILKSGATYLPLDRKYPIDFIQRILNISDASHFIFSDGTDFDFEYCEERSISCIDVSDVLKRSCSNVSNNLSLEMTGDEVAYICFTSGSKGESKGISVSHKSVALHLHSFLSSIQLTGDDRVLQFAALTFDVSVEQMFSTWSSGACLVPRGDEVWSAREFVERIHEQEVSVANLPTAYWNEIGKICGRMGYGFAKSSLRMVIVGGESMLAEAVRVWNGLGVERISLLNAYGPTEAVITASIGEIVSGDDKSNGDTSLPIGKSLSGRKNFVLDHLGASAPLGVPGELCLSGPILASGFLKNPRSTAEYFQPNPFASRDGNRDGAGGRLYRTGDWVKELVGGRLVFIERKDDEVKVRGIRVKPSLIESRLMEHPDITEAAVVVRSESNDVVLDESSLEIDYNEVLSRLPDGYLESVFDEISESGSWESDESAGLEPRLTLKKHEAEFEISLSIRDGNFVLPPKQAQRNWHLNRAMEEWAADLKELDAQTKRFVPGSERIEIEDDLAKSKVSLDQGELKFNEQQVMQDWQKPLMRELARLVSGSEKDVLEIGFGMGISASFVQEFGAKSHVIVEANPDVAESAKAWSARYPNSKIKIVNARWQDVIEDLGQFDGILFDTYPMTEAEFREHVLSDITFAEHFFEAAAERLKSGGAFTYYSNEIDTLSRRHQRRLLECFDTFQVGVVRGLQPPPDSQNWWANSMATISANKF